MVAAYRLLGVVSAVALIVYGLLSLAVLVGLGATLTLPGIAGFVLAVGMAVDANVLVFERAKEEFTAGRRPRGALGTGYKKAWTAIIDSNVTTLLAAVLLIFLGSGAIRGFGVTLSVGVVVSMFSALVVAKVLSDVLLRNPSLAKNADRLGLTAWAGVRERLEQRNPDLIGRRRTWFAISGVIVVLAVAGLGVRGVTYGLEFSGGRLVEYATAQPVDVDALRSDLTDAGVPTGAVQTTGDGNVAIRTPQLDETQSAAVEATVAELGGQTEVIRDEFIGPTIGAELRRNALIALGVALAAQLAYLAVRFRWTYGSAAVVAMAHDVVILLGVFAWLGKSFDGVFLAALLTVIGYSINDSVVIFDRVRERRAEQPNRPLATVANDALLQTLPRTVNTGIGAWFILAALFVLGGDSLTDFALALLIGTVVGMYSSVFTAAPLAVILEQRTSAHEARRADLPAGKTGRRNPRADLDRKPVG
jgi:SecD/SecF fusion protein